MRFDVPALDKELGLDVYLTETEGIGGHLRENVEDFVVEEIPLAFSSIEEFTSHTLSRTPSKYEKYAICLLEKRGIDTIRAASIIAQRLYLDEEEVGYCGLKDAKAVSRQLLSIPFRRPLQREYEFPEGIRLQLLGFRYRPLGIGELQGNKFSITARGIELGSKALVETLESVTREIHGIGGFPGYFGYQRFGSRRPISHLVGRMIHQGNSEGALNLLLALPRQAESKVRGEGGERHALEADHENAADLLPEHLGYEKRLRKYLDLHPKDFEVAIEKLPTRLRKLFYDAYQSYLFNKALSIRFARRKTLTTVEEGDLVASFDGRGYVRKLTKISPHNRSKIESELAEQKVCSVISIPSQLDVESSHPISPEVVSVIESEGLTHTKPASRRGLSGIVRLIIAPVKELGWIVGEDELNLGFRKVVFHFELHRGFYATMLLREFMKPQDPSPSGF